MGLEIPQPVQDAMAAFDARGDVFEMMDIEGALREAIKQVKDLSPDIRRGVWAEAAACMFDTHPAANGGPWKTYFQPQMSGTNGDGTPFYEPDLRSADAETVAYWAQRAKAAKHPILVARYADLVWDASKFAGTGKPNIEFAHLAIDAYVAALRMDTNGDAWGDNFYNLSRALQLAMSISDKQRTASVVQAILDYADATAEDDKLGTYAYLLDDLLPPEKGPPLTDAQEQKIIKLFEDKFAANTGGGVAFLSPHGVKDIAERLCGYYGQKGKPEERKRLLAATAAVFEKHAGERDALAAIFFLQDAQKLYREAGLPAEAERVQAKSQEMGAAAEKEMDRHSATVEVPKEEVDRYLAAMIDGGFEQAIPRLTSGFIPTQQSVADRKAGIDKEAPLYAMMSENAKVMGDGTIEADIGDERGDPDGKAVYQTAQHFQLDAGWLGLVFRHFRENGLNADVILKYVFGCPLFAANRHRLVREGVEAYFAGDHIKAIHTLVPQIERALVQLPRADGKSSIKPHRSGRGTMQAKSLNDVLGKDDWPIPGDGGEDLRMYLLSALAHPKGLNIRNDVCHGLWSDDQFSEAASDRVLHALLAVALIRPSSAANANPANAPTSKQGGGGEMPPNAGKTAE